MNIQKNVAVLVGLTAGLLVGAPMVAGAQTTGARVDPRWTIEVFAGGAISDDSVKGIPDTAFPAGEPFALASGRPSRRVSSWQFGDGTALLNTTLDRFTDFSGTVFPHVVPLDAGLGTAVATRRHGAAGGVRLGRRVTQHVAVEMALERRWTPLDFTDAFTDAMDRTNESFRAAFQSWLSTSPLTNLQITSERHTSGVSTPQMRLTGAVRWTLLTRGSLAAHLSAGAGVDRNDAKAPTAVMRGSYSGLMQGGAPLHEIDEVTICVAQPRVVPVGMLGLGATWERSGAFGLRVDAAWSWTGGSRAVTLEAAPTRIAIGTPGVMPTLTSPAIQFSTTPGQPSSLSGPRVAQTTFTGSGLHRQVSFTAGIFRRF
jgi:hypothetical protein